MIEEMIEFPSGVNITSPVFFCNMPAESLYTKLSVYLTGFLNVGSAKAGKVSSLNRVISKERALCNLLLISSFAIICLLSLSKRGFSQEKNEKIITTENIYFINSV